MSKNTLVAYFSASGVTKNVAEGLAKAAGADLFEIIPAIPYTRADLDWTDKNSRSTVEMGNKSFRPQIANKLNNMEQYQTILLGFPIWWYIAPTIINTFLESYDWEGKTIILFATSGGSGFGQTIEHLRTSLPTTAVIKEGKLMNHKTAATSLNEFIKSLGL